MSELGERICVMASNGKALYIIKHENDLIYNIKFRNNFCKNKNKQEKVTRSLYLQLVSGCFLTVSKRSRSRQATTKRENNSSLFAYQWCSAHAVDSLI